MPSVLIAQKEALNVDGIQTIYTICLCDMPDEKDRRHNKFITPFLKLRDPYWLSYVLTCYAYCLIAIYCCNLGTMAELRYLTHLPINEVGHDLFPKLLLPDSLRTFAWDCNGGGWRRGQGTGNFPSQIS